MATKRGGSIVRFYLLSYTFLLRAKKVLLPAVCLLFACAACAQTTRPADDSIQRGVLSEDTVYDVVQEPPPAEESETTIDTDRIEYFTNKNYGLALDSIELRQLPDSVLKALREEDAFWYSKKKSKGNTMAPPSGQQGEKVTTRPIEPEKPRERVSSQSWFQTLLWIVIIGGFIVFIIIWLSGSNIGLFRKKSTAITGEHEETETEDIFAINYQKEIDRAAGAGNYRLAIRLMFLRSLKTMAEKNVIRYRQDSTNLDYLMQLGSSHHYNDFFRITRNYEYSWYGLFEVKEEAYQMIRSDFDNFDRKLR